MITDQDLKEFSLLLRHPTTKWKKAHWKCAAQLLSSHPPLKPLLTRYLFQKYRNDLSEHIRAGRKPSTKKAGRRSRISPALARNQLDLVEQIKEELVINRKISRGTDTAAAKEIADDMYREKVVPGASREQLVGYVVGRIKYLKQVAK